MAAVGFCVVLAFFALVIAGLIGLLAGGENAAGTTELTGPTQISTQQPSTEMTQQTQPSMETTQPSTAETTQTETQEDPQGSSGGHMSGDSGASVDVENTVINNPNETGNVTHGIDVSRYQGTIDWAQVAKSGIDFVMVRVGYRETVSGSIVADANARYNMQEAQKQGIKLGAYFFSSAVTKAEAEEEANWVADYISQYAITYPVAYNCEGFTDPQSRQYSLTKAERTDLALAFLDVIAQRGYTPMFYASKSEMQGDAQWEVSRIGYKVWVAQYPQQPYPQTESSSYTGQHAMWQYTNNGTVPGISQSVDVNIAYFGYTQTEDPKNEEDPEQVEVDIEALMVFSQVSETVTAKIETNLRSVPSQGEESTVVYTLQNGETVTRTGISDSGWSRVEWNGQICYAVSSYLTTDLSYEPPVQIKTPFTEVSEQVTAKDAVNLRTLPSVTDPNSQVVVQLQNGEVVTRTGINEDVGWSRVEYNGQTLYCISSYLMLYTEE